MQSKSLIFTASGLLILCGTLIIVQLHDDRGKKPMRAVNHRTANPLCRTSRKGIITKYADDAARGAFLPSAKHDSTPQGSRFTGVQLAENVKLPAVILAIKEADQEVEQRGNTAVTAAMHGMVDTFYRDLIDHHAAGDTSEVLNTGDILVIHPSRSVDQAREQADQTYRTLFGDAAHDQMTMRALLEAGLPAKVMGLGK